MLQEGPINVKWILHALLRDPLNLNFLPYFIWEKTTASILNFPSVYRGGILAPV